MAVEMQVLAWYGLLIALTVVWQVSMLVAQEGLSYFVEPRDETRAFEGMAGRLCRVLMNSAVAFAYFAPAALLIREKGLSSEMTALTAWTFLAARAAYVPLYTFGVPWLRGIASAVALLAAVNLYWIAL